LRTKKGFAAMDKEFLSQIDQVKELLPDETNEKLQEDVLICECFCVSVQDIREACQELNKVNLDLLKKEFHLGQGCQGCLKRIDSWQYKIFIE
jgi:NAD(P)H-nitrite reductase large subunit